MTRVLLVPDLPVEGWPSMDRYASRLAHGLVRHASDLEIAVAGEISKLTQEPEEPTPGIRRISRATPRELPAPRVGELGRYVSRYLLYPQRVRSMQADVLHILDHSYGHMLLNRRDRPAVVTVHDLLPLITVRRGAATLRERIRNRLLTRVLEGICQADAWIVATNWLRCELAEWLQREAKIHIIPYGVDDAFFEAPAESRPAVRDKWGVPQNAFVVLHVGSTGPRKNIGMVVSGVHGLRQAGLDAWLVQVGGSFTLEHQRDIAAREITGFVRPVGETSEKDLRAAYQAADVLLFPSHYEGFGLPLLEAMASGLPVVASGAGALAEVAGDAAVVVEGWEPEAYVLALRDLASNSSRQEELIGRGLERARQFRWVDTARRTAEVYRNLA